MYSTYPPFGPPSSVHSGSSALEGVLKNGAAAAAAAAMNMHTMQLEWLARTGMLYHRFPELAGKFQLKFKRTKNCFIIFDNLAYFFSDIIKLILKPYIFLKVEAPQAHVSSSGRWLRSQVG